MSINRTETLLIASYHNTNSCYNYVIFFNKPIQTNQTAWLYNQSGEIVKNTRLNRSTKCSKMSTDGVIYWDATEKKNSEGML